MKKIFKRGLILFVLITKVFSVQAKSDTIFIDRMLMGNSTGVHFFNPFIPEKSIDFFRAKDEIIYYVANISIINPTKKTYRIGIFCVDSRGKLVFKAIVKRALCDYEYKLGKDTIKGVSQTLGLEPKPGAIIKGQFMPLESDKDYYIKLYVEKKLIGLSKFHYIANKL